MNLAIFITLALALLAVTLFVLLRTVLKVDQNKNSELEQQRQADNLSHLKKQLADFATKLEANEISQSEYEQYKLDAEQRLLQNIDNTSTKESKTHLPIALVIVLCVALPLASILLYIGLGKPLALTDNFAKSTETVRNEPRTIEQVKNELLARIKKDPNDTDAQFSLGRLYYANNQFVESRTIFESLYKKQSDNPHVLVAYAEAIARTQNGLFKNEPTKLVQRAVKVDPKHKKANWLLGIAAFQEGDSASALNIWQGQLKRSDNSPQEIQMLEQMVTRAGGEIDKPKLNADDAHLSVSVSLSEILLAKVSASDSVYIYAKAAAGPPMPLAIFKTTADKLPISLTLTDADAMTPQMKLSSFPEIVAYARVSKSGDAITQSGDLQGKSAVISNNQQISIIIDSIIP